MSRSGYSEDGDNIVLYRRAVGNAMSGKRGQAFLREMRDALDAMPVKELARYVFSDSELGCCAMGAVAVARGISNMVTDPGDMKLLGKVLGIAPCMAGEIAFTNDDDFSMIAEDETPAERWKRMRKWVDDAIEFPRNGEV